MPKEVTFESVRGACQQSEYFLSVRDVVNLGNFENTSENHIKVKDVLEEMYASGYLDVRIGFTDHKRYYFYRR